MGSNFKQGGTTRERYIYIKRDVEKRGKETGSLGWGERKRGKQVSSQKVNLETKI